MFHLARPHISQIFEESTLRTSVSCVRCFSLSSPDQGKNIKNFHLHNRRGTKQFKKEQFNKHFPKYPDVPIHHYGVRNPVVKHFAQVEQVPEMIPELIVPDLDNCKLKPYVSYATKDIYQEELTSKDLFNVIYGPKIISDFKSGKLDEEGNPTDPSPIEKLDPEEAYIRARQTGSDIFQGGNPVNKTYKLDIPVGKL